MKSLQSFTQHFNILNTFRHVQFKSLIVCLLIGLFSISLISCEEEPTETDDEELTDEEILLLFVLPEVLDFKSSDIDSTTYHEQEIDIRE